MDSDFPDIKQLESVIIETSRRQRELDFKFRSVFRGKKVDQRLAQGFRESLDSVLGNKGSEVVMRIGQVPEDRFDPVEIESSLNLVFGAGPEGLSSVHETILEATSSRLGVGLPQS